MLNLHSYIITMGNFQYPVYNITALNSISQLYIEYWKLPFDQNR